MMFHKKGRLCPTPLYQLILLAIHPHTREVFLCNKEILNACYRIETCKALLNTPHSKNNLVINKPLLITSGNNLR